MITVEEDEEETIARTAVLLGSNNNMMMILSICNILVSGRCLLCSKTAGVVTAMVLRSLSRCGCGRDVGCGCWVVGGWWRGFLDKKEGDDIQFMSAKQNHPCP